MSIDIDTLKRGDRVSLDGDVGEVIAIDLDNNEVTVEVELGYGMVDDFTVDCGEAWLTRA